MSDYKATHFAMYGGVTMKRGYCEDCDGFAFIIDGRLNCCGKSFEKEAKKIKRMCAPDYKRYLSVKAKREILKSQDYRCAYCWKEIGTYVRRHGELVLLQVNYDHQVPFAYVSETKERNIVAACHVCNGLKSDFIFQSFDDARLFLIEKRSEKGYDF